MDDIDVPGPARTYALVENALVMQLVQSSTPISELFVPGMPWRDISDLSPQPQVGWSYTPATDTAAESYSPPVIAPLTSITGAAFLALLTSDELTAITKIAIGDAGTLAWLLSLSMAGSMVQLDDPALKSRLDALVSAGALTADRESVLLADGVTTAN
ncbi:hypothetical protein FHR90_003303 [Endobacter medicaginis]|uniref:Uncharacterized protein n=1 Tax=Endobacter medicaginis TaxID=1181271 RepID=A0A850NRE2_9PROT|nr:hypothetical protein [Endobacter medicaginis]MBB3175447.1 hypothetical protein [Endobacter medicaginis]MCX5477118.1 hypothetical protein [Endobacter medicaginis]NVN29825.1 hypothetical protein [Endobacter medicaginis]